MRMIQAFFTDDNGFIVSAELVLVLTIAVLAMVVGLSEVAVAVNTELNDISNAFGALNQSYAFTGFCSSSNGKTKATMSGSAFMDSTDDCDVNTTCEIVSGVNPWTSEGNSGFGGH